MFPNLHPSHRAYHFRYLQRLFHTYIEGGGGASLGKAKIKTSLGFPTLLQFWRQQIYIEMKRERER